MTTPAAGAGRHRRTDEAPRRVDLRLPTLVLAVLCLPAAVAIIVFLVRTPSTGAATGPGGGISLTSQTSRQAMAAARTSAQQVLSYDYRSITADIKRAQGDATGSFAKQYASTAPQLLSQAKQQRAIVQATIGAGGVVSATAHDVVVLLFVDQASVRQPAAQKSPTTRIDQSRVQLTMTRSGNRWLISSLQAL